MDTTTAQRERQLAREALIALAAIALAGGFLCLVVCWKYGVFAPGPKPGPVIDRLADVAPQFAESASVPAAPRARSPAFLPPPPQANAAAPEPVSASEWTPRVAESNEPLPEESQIGGTWTPAGTDAPDAPDAAQYAAPAVNSAPRFDELELQPPDCVHVLVESTEQVASHRVAQASYIRHSADAPPRQQELARVAEQRVAFAAQRLVTPFIEDELRSAPTPASVTPETAASQGQASLAVATESLARTDTVTVGPGDSFFAIARRVYGTAEFYKALYHHNRDRFRRANSLPIGAVVATPAAEELQQLYPHLSPPAPY
jgi:nucleoid-associated protein YgaU